jgi:hypothetical protein
MRDEHKTDELVELGAATELTLGLYDPTSKEEFVIPEARD